MPVTLLKSLSIPAWFDWRVCSNDQLDRMLGLSIPAWFDWRIPARPAAWAAGRAFNPSLVRLAPPYLRPDLQADPLSIPAWFDWRPAIPNHSPLPGPAFNPSLVRLARSSCQQGPWGQRTFNPSLVRLARAPDLPTQHPVQPFNPSLVRLAHVARRIGTEILDDFQSQLGSIGARDAFLKAAG